MNNKETIKMFVGVRQPKPSFLHRLRHILRLNTGIVVAFTDEEERKIVICFKCTTCKDLSGCHYFNNFKI